VAFFPFGKGTLGLELGLMLKLGFLLVIITGPTKSNCLTLTPHKASPPQPNGTFAEYVDVYSPLLSQNTRLPLVQSMLRKEEGVEADLQELQDFDEFEY
jgi:hypothetical protein